MGLVRAEGNGEPSAQQAAVGVRSVLWAESDSLGDVGFLLGRVPVRARSVTVQALGCVSAGDGHAPRSTTLRQMGHRALASWLPELGGGLPGSVVQLHDVLLGHNCRARW